MTPALDRLLLRHVMAPAGYSKTPLSKKLGMKEGALVLLRHAPEGFARSLGELPQGVDVRRDMRSKGPFDVILLFCANRAELERDLAPAIDRLAEDGGLWIAWPKKSSGVETDLADGVVRERGLETGLVDNKVCAVDETWSGLRFVVRVKDRKRSTRGKR